MELTALIHNRSDVTRHQVDNNTANEWKNIRKARLQRMVMQDPSLAGKLVATEASPVYNAKGDLIQAVSSVNLTG